jgi:hypothetical protein
MKDKCTDFAAGRLGRSRATAPGASGAPRQAGNYGINRLGIVPEQDPAPVVPPDCATSGEGVSSSHAAHVPAANDVEPAATIAAEPSATFASNDDAATPVPPPTPHWPAYASASPPEGGADLIADPTADRLFRATQDAAPSTHWQRVRQFARRRPALAVGAAAAVLCAALCLTLMRGGDSGVPRGASADTAHLPPADNGGAANAGPAKTAQAPAPAAIPSRRAASPAPVVIGTPVRPAPPAAPQDGDDSLSKAAEDFVAGVRSGLEGWGRKAAAVPNEANIARYGKSASPPLSQMPAPPPPAVTPPPAPPPLRPVNVGYSNEKGLVVTAILRGSGGPVAVINNELHRPGQIVGEAKVVRIGESEVELEEAGRRFLISVSAAPPAAPTNQAAEEDESAGDEQPKDRPKEQPKSPKKTRK